jgi:acyl carrier protein
MVSYSPSLWQAPVLAAAPCARMTPLKPGRFAMLDRAFIRSTLIELLEADTGEKHTDLRDDVNLREGLGLDSVDVVSIVSQVERRFHIRLTHEELEKLATVADVLNLLETKLTKAATPGAPPQAA